MSGEINVSPPGDGLLHRRGLLAPADCAGWLHGVYAARADWTPNFEGVQFTLGRAYYTHLEEDRAGDYFRGARASDAAVERALPGMQAAVRAILGDLVGAPVAPRVGWCGPGLHVFPAQGWLAEHGGDVHFDTEGLSEAARAARAPALSAVVMLQPPARGGGLRVWDALYDGSDQPPPDLDAIPSRLVESGVGDLLLIDSYRLHQIQPFGGARDRVSITAHLVREPAGGWRCWF